MLSLKAKSIYFSQMNKLFYLSGRCVWLDGGFHVSFLGFSRRVQEDSEVDKGVFRTSAKRHGRALRWNTNLRKESEESSIAGQRLFNPFLKEKTAHFLNPSCVGRFGIHGLIMLESLWRDAVCLSVMIRELCLYG